MPKPRKSEAKDGLAEGSPPHYFGHRERLRERFIDAGPDAVSEYELLELVLFRAIPRRDVKPLAKALIAKFGSFGEAVSAPRQRLREVDGLGEAAIVDLKIVQAAASRLARGQAKKRTVLSSWTAVLDYVRTAMAFSDKEQFRVIFLDKRNQVIADEVQQTGTVDHTPVYPREVVKRALEVSATAIILVHNHPSGDPTPSRADIRPGGVMRAAVCALVAATGLLAHPALAQTDRAGAAFWKSVQANCTATAAKPPGELGRRIAQTAIGEFAQFGGHKIDSNGRLFHFGVTEAEHEADDGGDRPATFGRLAWWQVMKYWRSLFGAETADKIEARGYRDASTETEETKETSVLRSSAGRLMRAAESETDPAEREILREAALRAAIIDTPWSAAFISYVVKEAGVAPSAFKFSNAHRAYIYDAFAASAAELTNEAGERAYRACPLETTRPRPGDLICHQREPSLADASDEAVRERIRTELAGGTDARSVRRTHCDVVASIDAPARKMYVIGGNVSEAVTAKKLNLRRDLKFSAVQKGHCGAGHWTLPGPAGAAPGAPDKCSLNDRKWFVLLQLR